MYLRILQKRQCSPSLDCYNSEFHSGKPVIFKMGFVLLLYVIMKKIIKITDAVILKFQLSLDLKAVVVTMQNVLEIEYMLLSVSV